MNLFKGFSRSWRLHPLLVFLLLGWAAAAHARDMSARLGVGFVDEFSNSSGTRTVPAISLKYGLSKDLAVSGILGFNTAVPTAATIGGKVFRNLFFEQNLNFYTALGFAYVKGTNSGVELLGLLGAEFFIPGIESLGFSFETGVSANNATGSFALKTVGFTFLHAGMHFYF